MFFRTDKTRGTMRYHGQYLRFLKGIYSVSLHARSLLYTISIQKITCSYFITQRFTKQLINDLALSGSASINTVTLDKEKSRGEVFVSVCDIHNTVCYTYLYFFSDLVTLIMLCVSERKFCHFFIYK